MIKNNILYSITSFVSSRLFAMIHRIWIIRIFFFFSLTLTINVWANIVRWRSRRPLWTNDTISREKWIVFIITILITIVQSTSLFAQQMLLCFILQFYFFVSETTDTETWHENIWETSRLTFTSQSNICTLAYTIQTFHKWLYKWNWDWFDCSVDIFSFPCPNTQLLR